MTANKVTLLKKITMSEVFGVVRASGGFKPKTHFGADADGNFDPILIMRVAGVVHTTTQGTTNYGDYVIFKGNFAAYDRKGKQFRSPNLILPPPADGLTLAAFQDGEGSPVELAFDIFAVPDAGDRGYKFQVQPLMQQTQADPLDQLLSSVNSAFALPAPVATPIENEAAKNAAAGEEKSGKAKK